MPGRVNIVLGRLLGIHRVNLRLRRWYSTVDDLSGGQAELYDDTPRTIRDLVTLSRAKVLCLTLSPYLPPLKTSDSTALSILPPGYHFAYFPTSTSELDTLEDGYEKHFAPTGGRQFSGGPFHSEESYPFKRRLWTQGNLEFKGKELILGEWAECKERVYKIGQDKSATDVWIDRRIYNSASTGHPEDWVIRELRCLRYLREFPP